MKKILVPIDGSYNSLEALKCARDMADKFGSKIIIVNAQKVSNEAIATSESLDVDQEVLKENAKKIINKAMEVIKGTSVNVKTETVIGDPAEQILYLIDKEGADMVVMGSHGLSGIRRFLIGSVSNKVLQHSPKPVMIIK